MVEESFEPQCRLCGATYDSKRYDIGFLFCLSCGDEVAHSVKRIVQIPYSKGAYQYIHNPNDLCFTNPKRTT
jgi:ribosomal protein L37AE/L43A